jgi:hypothetical protein
MNFLETAFHIKAENPCGELHYMSLEKTEPNPFNDNSSFGNLLNIGVKTKFFQLETYQIKSSFPATIEKDLSELHGIDSSSMVISALENEHDMNCNRKLYEKYLHLGSSSRIKKIKESKWKKFLLRFIPDHHFSLHFNSPSELVSKILVYSRYIGSKTRIGNGDFIVCSPKILTYLHDNPAFEFLPQRSLSSSPRIEPAGSIHGIKVFVNRSSDWMDNKIVIGRTTSKEQPGVYYIEGDKKVENLVNEIDLSKTTLLSHRMAFVDVEGENNYFLLLANDTKKPFWKKILSIKE